MRTLYLDLSMGVAGDMLASSLLELVDDRQVFVSRLNALGIPGVTYTLTQSVKCGITGSHLTVTVNGEEEHSHDHHDHHDHDHEHEHHHDHEHEHDHEHHHHHSSLEDIRHIVCEHLPLPEKVKSDVMAVYDQIAEAESHVHGVPVSQIHFHEVGTMDAVADITAVCLLLYEISPDEIVVSDVHVGSGHVHCAHGILPVPAPATAYILKGLPVYSTDVKGELCTPTGAALVRHFATRFDSMPHMRISKIGYGMGNKDFEIANCVRSVLGETGKNDEDCVLELCANIDDMSPEALSFACERILESGSLDVFVTPVVMKKSRSAWLLTVLCKEKFRDEVVKAVFRHTSTIGIRYSEKKRFVLTRSEEVVTTQLGNVRKKVSEGFGVRREKFEFDDLSRIARDNEISLDEVMDLVRRGN